MVGGTFSAPRSTVWLVVEDDRSRVGPAPAGGTVGGRGESFRWSVGGTPLVRSFAGSVWRGSSLNIGVPSLPAPLPDVELANGRSSSSSLEPKAPRIERPAFDITP